MVVYELFFATLKRRPLKQSIGATLFLLKNRRFFNKNNVALKSPFRRTPFERSEKQCVNRHKRRVGE